jgi:glycine/D-amino acid oxidase-like deaminating enzyme
MVRSADGSTVRGADVDGALVEADAVVIAMGPWSLMAAAWVHLPAVFGRRSPSLVYDTGRDVAADVLFLEYHEESGAVLTSKSSLVPTGVPTLSPYPTKLPCLSIRPL